MHATAQHPELGGAPEGVEELDEEEMVGLVVERVQRTKRYPKHSAVLGLQVDDVTWGRVLQKAKRARKDSAV